MSVYRLLASCKRAEVSVKWPTLSMFRTRWLADYWTGTNKPKMLKFEPVQVVPGKRQEYSIDSSITMLYEIRYHTVNQIVANVHPSYRSDDKKLSSCNPSSCSMSPGCAYLDKSSHCPHTWFRERQNWGARRWSRWTSLTGVVTFATSQGDFMTDLAMDR